MQKKFPDYPVPSFPAVDANTSLQKLMDLASATKVGLFVCLFVWLCVRGERRRARYYIHFNYMHIQHCSIHLCFYYSYTSPASLECLCHMPNVLLLLRRTGSNSTRRCMMNILHLQKNWYLFIFITYSVLYIFHSISSSLSYPSSHHNSSGSHRS